MSEKHTQNEILRTFGTRADMRLWRTNTGVAKLRGQTVRFGIPGQADLHGILPGGVFLAIEVKSEIGKQSPEQLAYQAMVGKFGGVYVLARSVADVWAAIGKYLQTPGPVAQFASAVGRAVAAQIDDELRRSMPPRKPTPTTEKL